MTPEAILADLLASGIEPRVHPARRVILVPRGKLSPAQRNAILANKPALVDLLEDVEDAAEVAISRAMGALHPPATL